MTNSMLNHFSIGYKEILVDEIALEGLEGIGLEALWRRIEKRISAPVTEKMKLRYWNFLVNCSALTFYVLPEPAPVIKIVDRFTLIDEETNDVKDPTDYLDGPYEYCPIENEHGSCKYYNTRYCLLKANLKHTTYEKVFAEYGKFLVIVASIELRWQALSQHMPMTYLNQLTQIHYCILELVGRGRENGQMTTGTTNLTKIVKESKNLFYNRKFLHDLDLIRVQYITQITAGRGGKCLLLRLKRFHQPSILSMPKVGMLSDAISFLLTQPNYTVNVDVLFKKKIMTPSQARRLRKTINIFCFDERVPDEASTGKKTKSPIKKKFITLVTKSDESSQSEEESTGPPLKCQYKIGVNLLRQAYERFLDAGLTGLNQLELAQLLGVEFYTSRSICRLLKLRNIVREYLEDRGKQRTARYIAIAAGKLDVKYAEEKQKFLDYISTINEKQSTSNAEPDPEPELEPVFSIDTSEITQGSSKRRKFEHECQNQGNEITEVKVLEGVDDTNVKSLLESKKELTLRQLKYANGLLKVVGDKLAVSGYQTLSKLVSKEIGESPMVTKALKLFIQKLVLDGHLKIFRVKWPGHEQKYSTFICAAHLKVTDPIIRSKYKEICLRSWTQKTPKIKQEPIEDIPTRLQFPCPRFMKLQNLHECLMKFTYFEPTVKSSHNLSEGFVDLIDLMPEITVKFAVSNISNAGMSDISHIKIYEPQLNLKLKDAPTDVCQVLLQSSSLKNAFRWNLNQLAMLGLLQLIYKHNAQNSDYLSNALIYVNRKAKVINTTGEWPRPNADIQSLEKTFTFDKFEDVKTYWTTLYEISTSTRITIPNRVKKKLEPPIRMQSDVIKNDTGDRYGDGKGPCGFDSSFFMDIPRLWRTFYLRPPGRNSESKRKMSSIKIPKLDPKKSKLKAKKKSNPKIRELSKKILASKEKRQRKRLSNTSLAWSKKEDMIIMLCKAAITIISPTSQPGCLQVRNMVAKDLLSLNDPKKTQGECHRRALTLDSNASLSHEKECLLNEMRRRRSLIQKYEGLLRKLRLRHSTNLSKFISEARVPMLELVWLMMQVLESKSYTQRVPCIAMNIENFHENFTIMVSTGNKTLNLYTATDNIVLKEAILLTVMLSFNYELEAETAQKIYNVFKTYPETTLRVAVDQLRKCGAIVAKEKILNNQMHRIHLEDIVQCAYRISAGYKRKWICRLNNEFSEILADTSMSDSVQPNIKGTAEMNCFLCEAHACGYIDIVSATTPIITDSTGTAVVLSHEEQINVTDIESKFKLKSGCVRWKNQTHNKVSTFFECNYDLDDIWNSMTNASIVNLINQKPDLEDDIIQHLRIKGAEGASYDELQEISRIEDVPLKKRLAELESKSIIKCVGYHNNLFILVEYIEKWTIKVEDKFIIPTPWLTVDWKIRHNIFLKWTGVVMNKIFECPGCSLYYIAENVEYLSSRAIQNICEFLVKCECITLKTIKVYEIDLFTTDDIEPDLCDYNEYASTDNILAFPMKNSLTKFSCLKKTIENNYCKENT